DPNMTEGATNGDDDAHIITDGVANAAPVSVYQNERYGGDFSYRLPVPAGKTYTVRLHFAEIFDSEVGERVENVAINGKPALTNFDILAAAGGTVGKAVVKEFTGLQPDAKGDIVIRVSAAPNSPDGNAKISGIEILEAGG